MPKLKTKDRPSTTRPQDAKRISTEWLYGLEPEEATQFEQTWRSSTYVFDQLKSILERHRAEIDIDKEDDYNNPNWPIARADRNGQLRALNKILRLLP